MPPSLATLHETAPSGTQWIHEIKFDGYRLQARLDHGEVRLLTRKQQDWTHRFKIVADAVAELAVDSAIIDGELVVEDESGVSNFSQLQTDLKAGKLNGFVYYVFDLLNLDGRDLTGKPLTERKAALKRLLDASGDTGPIRLSESFNEDGATMLINACRMHLEGIVSKRKDAPYRSGRSENFIKSKCHDRQEFVVAGFTPSTAAPRAVGALTVGVYTNGKFTYAGRAALVDGDRLLERTLPSSSRLTMSQAPRWRSRKQSLDVGIVISAMIDFRSPRSRIRAKAVTVHQRAHVRRRRICQPFEVVAAFEHRDNAALGMLVGHAPSCESPDEIRLDQIEFQRIAAMSIEAGRDNDQIRPEGIDGRQQDRARNASRKQPSHRPL